MHIAELSRLIGVEKDLLKKWLFLFEEYFSTSAVHPQAGHPRIFVQSDIKRILVIANSRDWWEEEDDGDYSDVYRQLNSSEEYEERYLHDAYMKAPLFQPIPDSPEEMATYSVVFGESWMGTDLAAIARSYKLAGDVLTDQALENEDPWKFANPILFCYRHSIELFLKAIVRPKKANHDLRALVQGLEKQLESRLRPDVKLILDQFAENDPNSTTFRYGEAERGVNLPCDEAIVNLHQLNYIMKMLTEGFEEVLGYPNSF